MRTLEIQAEFHYGNVTKKFSFKITKQMERLHYDAFKCKSCKTDCEWSHLRTVTYKTTADPLIGPFRELRLRK
jgi:hypothetical protein